ncbi:MAG: leucine-rich repeat domain-containing protein [Aureispira sp.]|nr:leucine-rich repeat domain-containing protein [Aureispira sp.]
MDNSILQIKNLLTSPNYDNRRLALVLLSQQDDYTKLLDLFLEEGMILIIRSPKVLKQFVKSEKFAFDSSFRHAIYSYGYCFESDGPPYYFIPKEATRFRVNQIKQWDSYLGELTELIYFCLDDNQLKELPKGIEKLRKVEQLEITGNDFSIFPLELLVSEKLRDLFYQRNKTRQLPPNFEHLTCKRLYFSGNRFERFPNNKHFHFPNLEMLGLQANGLKELDDFWEIIPKLKVLFLGDNPIEQLPENIGLLKDLTNLNLKNTKLKELPDSILKNKRLETLVLENSPIESLPKGFEKLNLKLLDLRGTPLSLDKDYIAFLEKKWAKRYKKTEIRI